VILFFNKIIFIMKKLSYFFAVLLASSLMLFSCDGQQGARDERGRAPGTQDGIYQEDDRGMYREDQNRRQMQEDQGRQQQPLYEQDTLDQQQRGTQQPLN
jgi:hypothetical protein